MKTALIIPGKNQEKFVLRERPIAGFSKTPTPPYLAAELASEHNAKVFDASINNWTPEQTKNKIKNYKPDHTILLASQFNLKNDKKYLSQLMNTTQVITPNAIPFSKKIPAFNKIQVKKYLENQEKHGIQPLLAISTTQGCPHACTYCTKANQKYIETKTPAHIISEIREYNRITDCRHYHIRDCEFGLNLKNAKKVCKAIIKSGLNITWETNNRVDHVDKELLELMKKSGCTKIKYGVETGDPTLQKKINKKLSHTTIKKAFALTKQANIQAHAYLIVGLPEETKQSLLSTSKLIHEIKPDNTSIAVFFLAPNTPLFTTLKKEGRILDENTNHYRNQKNKMTFKHKRYKHYYQVKQAQAWLILNTRNQYPIIQKILWKIIP